jgi:hypothetical protein
MVPPVAFLGAAGGATQGRAMLHDETVAEITRLLNERTPQRRIAELVQVSRTTVNGIATGKRRITRRRADPPPPDALPVQTGPRVRCGGCGGLTRLPCHVCIVSAMSFPRDDEPDDVDGLALDLKPVHRERYEQIRRRS